MMLPCLIFDNIADTKLISALRTGKSAFYLMIIQSFLNFLNFLHLENFSSFFIEISKGNALVYQIINIEYLRGNIRGIS